MADGGGAQVAPGFQFKGAMLPLTVLELYSYESQAFESALRERIDQAPGFFSGMPVAIGLEKFSGAEDEIDFPQILATCTRLDVQVVGVRGGGESLCAAARAAGLALLPAAATRPQRAEQVDPVEPEAETEAGDSTVGEAPMASSVTRVVKRPVRSGQQVCAPDGDLVILASVSAGAEVLAAGNVHVYGTLRGRALAGIHGDETARVFCQSLQAELVSIAGRYKISEHLQGSGWKQPAKAELRDDTLIVTPLVE